jgi:hypothetical protein
MRNYFLCISLLKEMIKGMVAIPGMWEVGVRGSQLWAKA